MQTFILLDKQFNGAIWQGFKKLSLSFDFWLQQKKSFITEFRRIVELYAMTF